MFVSLAERFDMDNLKIDTTQNNVICGDAK